MNKAITDGVVFMPPEFEDGLDVWSSEDGTPGTNTYDGAGNAAIVPADQDFDSCLELFKDQNTQKLRYMGQTPFEQGCYLRVRAKVKAISGPLPSVRIAARPSLTGGGHAGGYVETGPAVPLTAYGEVVEVSAIIGSGSRSSVDMVWGDDVAYAHMGLDLTGSNGAAVRIDEMVIEDVTGAYLRDMMDWVDVRDFGAAGDGVTDDRAAFAAADAASAGRTLLVPEGVFHIGSNLTLHSDIRFEGTVTMADNVYLSLTRSFDLPTYIDAFGTELLGFRKAFQALLHYADHETLDMCGRRIDVTEPIDMQAAYATSDTFLIRRVIKNGQFYVIGGAAWDDEVATSTAQYNPANPYKLTNVANISAIDPGAIIAGNGVGREVYVKTVNVGAAEVELSQPLWGAATNQSYTFTRHKYVLDFGGFAQVNRMNLVEVEFQCNNHSSAVMLPRDGENFVFQDCFFIKAKNHAISSTGRGCQDLHVDRCQFISGEQGLAATDRVSVAFNVNANDAKIRDSRFQRMGLSMIFHGSNHIIQGNHLFQGDEVSDGPRTPGMVFTYENNNAVIAGNYIDNCSIEWNNEHDEKPDFGSEYSFGGMTIANNTFLCIDAASWFKWILVKPFGTGHYVSGLHVTGNVFRSIAGTINRVDGVVSTHGTLDGWSMRDVTFENNAFVGINQRTMSPVTLEFNQNTVAGTWTLDGSDYFPFGGNARTVSSVVIEGALRDGSNNQVWDNPHVEVNKGASAQLAQLKWSKPVRGTAHVTLRVDRPN
ncbi:glycosyl hydrolase family 28-related protein [Aliiroseovarius sp. F20344]|uniref:glycosyl hydrolase family 28-related protein n=1 Tax=Aliiroseovarius sp. F20344 TaxID=2926414 RepID=UPI001FF24E17|nr:glycosyl hydrolase family 28-related protein [Aliiroseovarius sp. F20344]MCK0143248.1 right-handed parallel beta-helix repeat-containing protein [Aliiroseovarius sp. F20344]